ncbi:hypothetical protein LSTR_LSTR004713 [Laodelphax striatellus]|uniref:Origin recognition complex subunit 4 n=1 Tax=Laodelphax striatellus TaxID=195883 RepID=A0A482WTT8_LAOST|nr:hypothetical protein LSTR_LSTR004713 [Laodelphax striatellus]
MATGSDFVMIAGDYNNEAQAFLEKGAEVIIRMRGLPYDCTADEVLEFFARGDNACTVMGGTDGVLFVKKPDGQATGVAFVLFAEDEVAPKALSKHRQFIRSRYIELFRITYAEVQQILNRSMDPKTLKVTPAPLLALPALPQPMPLLPQHVVISGTRKDCIRLRGLPHEAQLENILEFLGEHAKNIVVQGVHMVYTEGQPSGEAFIQMDCQLSAFITAQLKHHRYMFLGKNLHYIEVLQCSGDDMSMLLTDNYPAPAAVSPVAKTLLSPGRLTKMPSHSKNGSAPAVHLCRRILKERISSLRVLDDLDSELSQIAFLMERTINASESDSVLIIGPPGCGKTMLVNEALEKLKASCDKDKYICVHLNGLIHTDDNLALKDIIHQMNVVFDGNKVTSSFSENLQLLLHSLRNGEDKISKAVIFVLEEFHLFCAHRNQTLLYNLFDTVQSTRGVCVIGLTSRLDVAEMLEKRVKSRYSHRQILLLQPATIEKRIQLFKKLLRLSSDRSRNNIDSVYRDKWNKNIDSLAADNRVIRCIQRQLELDGSESRFRSFLMLLVSQLDEDCPIITSDVIHNTHNRISSDDKVTLLEGLSVLEMCLIIAMSHQNEIYDGDPFNFEMIANRYMKFASQNSSIQIMQRPVLLKAFERIKHLELISAVSSTGRNSHKEFQLFNFLLTKEQVSAAVSRYSGMPTDVAQWASSCLM